MGKPLQNEGNYKQVLNKGETTSKLQGSGIVKRFSKELEKPLYLFIFLYVYNAYICFVKGTSQDTKSKVHKSHRVFAFGQTDIARCQSSASKNNVNMLVMTQNLRIARTELFSSCKQALGSLVSCEVSKVLSHTSGFYPCCCVRQMNSTSKVMRQAANLGPFWQNRSEVAAS